MRNMATWSNPLVCLQWWPGISGGMPAAPRHWLPAKAWQETVRMVASLLRKFHSPHSPHPSIPRQLREHVLHGFLKMSKSQHTWCKKQSVLGKQRCVFTEMPKPHCPLSQMPPFHTPDFPKLHSSATAQGPQFIVDSAWGPVFHNPGILIALTVTRDCLMHLWRTA